MPMTGLATLEQTLPLVGRHDLVEEALLGARVIQIVVDDIVAQSRPRHRSSLELSDCLAQRRWEALRIRFVGVPFQSGRKLEPLLNPVQAGRDQSRESEVRIDVTARNARLDPLGRSVPDDPEPARAV